MDVNKLVKDNEKLAYKVAHTFNPVTMVDLEDIKQIALIGLWKAVENFDETKGFQFSTFAYRVIRNEVLQELKKFKRTSSSLDEMELDLSYNESEFEDLVTREGIKVYLNDEEYSIVTMTIDGYTQKEISEMIQLSQSQISRVYIRAKEKIKGVVYSGSSNGES